MLTPFFDKQLVANVKWKAENATPARPQIWLLESISASVDSLSIYISDHGESLGEYGLYLHNFSFTLPSSTKAICASPSAHSFSQRALELFDGMPEIDLSEGWRFVEGTFTGGLD
jgi:hypothetical protein